MQNIVECGKDSFQKTTASVPCRGMPLTHDSERSPLLCVFPLLSIIKALLSVYFPLIFMFLFKPI